jgi:uncharacterized protein (DUF924 family)
MDSPPQENIDCLYNIFMFWYGLDKIKKDISSYNCSESLLRCQWDNIWFSKTNDIDTIITKKFADSIPLMINYKPSNVYECVGKMLLYDQVVRNVFRGTADAYKYDHIAKKLAYELMQNKNYDKYPLFVKVSVILTLIHSEVLEDHSVVAEQIRLLETYSDMSNFGVLKTLKEIAQRHRMRIELFGRLPERARIKKLNLTSAEQSFISNVA